MPLASWVVEFEAMSEVAQGVAVRDEKYTQEQLQVLAKYAKSSMVKRAIDEALQVDFTMDANVFQSDGLQSIFGKGAVEDADFEEMKPEMGNLKPETGIFTTEDAGEHRGVADVGEMEPEMDLNRQVAEDAEENGADGGEMEPQISQMNRDLAVRDSGDFSNPTRVADLDSISTTINADYADFQHFENAATMKALRIGMMLELVKEVLKHGQFGKWRDANCELSERHSQRFMELARGFLNAQKIGVLEFFGLESSARSSGELGLVEVTPKHEQALFDFVGERTIPELCEDLKVKWREKKVELPKIENDRPATQEELLEIRMGIARSFSAELSKKMREFTDDHAQYLTESELRGVVVGLEAYIHDLRAGFGQ